MKTKHVLSVTFKTYDVDMLHDIIRIATNLRRLMASGPVSVSWTVAKEGETLADALYRELTDINRKAADAFIDEQRRLYAETTREEEIERLVKPVPTEAELLAAMEENRKKDLDSEDDLG